MFDFLLEFAVPIAAIALSLWAIGAVTRRRVNREAAARAAALEQQVRGLLHRVWLLEQQATLDPGAPRPPADTGQLSLPGAVPPPVASPFSTPPPPRPPVPAAPEPAAPAARPGLDLEQRIGARWTTWIGIVAVLFAVSFFFRWAFEHELLGPGWRVALGVAAGLVVLAFGAGLGRRRDLLYLSEGLTGLGLGVLYLSLYGAHALYRFIGPGTALVAMSGVTVLGTLASVASGRQIAAVLAVLGGLLTPVLLVTGQRDERNLLAYLLVLNGFVLAVAAFRTWPALNRLAWVGTALLLAGPLTAEPRAARPLSRLLLLSALFALFLAIPLLRRGAARSRVGPFDLLLAVANAAGYFYAVHLTLADWQPRIAAAWALGLALVYRAVAAEHESRAPDDTDAISVHEGIAWTFLTLAIPLALGGPWVTLAWAAEGVALLWTARRAARPVAAWGGVLALVLATARVAMVDRWGAPTAERIWNLPFLGHLMVVAALVIGGWLAGRSALRRPAALDGARLRAALWLLAPLLLALLFWREPRGREAATLLTLECLMVGFWARVSRSPGPMLAALAVGAILLARVLGADDALARGDAGVLMGPALLSRLAAGAAVGLAGGWVARSPAWAHAWRLGRVMSAAGGAAMLYALSVGWTRYQDTQLAEAPASRRRDLSAEIQWRKQIGLSILWTLYAAAALAWGFFRSRPGLRYAALALLGVTVIKVFAVDLSAVRTAYRMLSFLVLGVVLLLVGFLYQKARARSAAAVAAPRDAPG